MKRTTSNHGGISLYRLTIASTRMLLATKRQLDAFSDGDSYAVYFVRVPGAPVILSAERQDVGG